MNSCKLVFAPVWAAVHSDVQGVGNNMIERIRKELETEFRKFPDNFFDTFDFTTTGRNMTHPLVLGELTKIVWKLPKVRFVGEDYRFNLGDGVKFQPDLVGFDSDLEPVIAIDYESPNSSDARVPGKDVCAYAKWVEFGKQSCPYIIITTLPDYKAPRWQLRYTGKSGCNHAFQGRKGEVTKNPKEFWYRFYRKTLNQRLLSNVCFLNISGKTVDRIVG